MDEVPRLLGIDRFLLGSFEKSLLTVAYEDKLSRFYSALWSPDGKKGWRAVHSSTSIDTALHSIQSLDYSLLRKGDGSNLSVIGDCHSVVFPYDVMPGNLSGIMEKDSSYGLVSSRHDSGVVKTDFVRWNCDPNFLSVYGPGDERVIASVGSKSFIDTIFTFDSVSFCIDALDDVLLGEKVRGFVGE